MPSERPNEPTTIVVDWFNARLHRVHRPDVLRSWRRLSRSFVNDPLWHIIGETDRWVAYHEALGPRVVVVLAIPALALSLIANVLLFVRRPPAVPAWTVAATLSLLLISTASTFAIQIPIQMALDVAYDRAALDHLIWSSLWLRDIPGGIRAAVAAYMLRLVVSGSTPVRVAAAGH